MTLLEIYSFNIEKCDSDSSKRNLKGSLYIGSSESHFSSSPESGPIAIGFNTVFFSVRAAYLMIFRSLAAEGAPSSSQIVLGLSIR
jgi:hypothetical protein